jgi:predicted transposase/invertase (TIGR01784 family)
MSRFIKPFTGFGFNKLFGEATSQEFLKSFLNELLRDENRVITDLKYMPADKTLRSSEERQAFFDVYCTDTSGKRFIVSLQNLERTNFRDQMMYYSMFPIQRQEKIRQLTGECPNVYIVSMLKHSVDDDAPDELISCLKFADADTGKIYADDLTYLFVYLPCFQKTANELSSLFDKWLFLLQHMEDLEQIPETIQDDVLMKFLEKAEVSTLSGIERFNYERSLKA